MMSAKWDSIISTPFLYPGSEQVKNKTKSKYWGQNTTFLMTEAKGEGPNFRFISQGNSASEN